MNLLLHQDGRPRSGGVGGSYPTGIVLGVLSQNLSLETSSNRRTKAQGNVPCCENVKQSEVMVG